MTTVKIELPDTIFSNLHQTAKALSKDIQLFAAATWYNTGKISLPEAVEITGLTYQEFVRTLSRLHMSPFKNTTQKKVLSKIEREHHAKEMMKFAGSWSDMPDEEFEDFMQDIENRRKSVYTQVHNYETFND